MAKKRSKKRPVMPGGELELALLSALWRHGDAGATARELFEELLDVRTLVYTTVTKVLDRLFEKRLVGRRRRGRAFVYRARVEQETAQREMARGLIEKLVGGAPRPAAAALLGALEEVSPELLEELAAELEERRSKNDGA